MSEKEKTVNGELDICGLLALKAYESPDGDRIEKNIQNIMREVRTTNNAPSLLFFPDKSFGWMFAQPRYGVAALFIVFLGLHLLERPLPATSVGTVMLRTPETAEAVAAAAGTNYVKKVPGLSSLYTSVVGEKKPEFTARKE
jgi:hypothetical protein